MADTAAIKQLIGYSLMGSYVLWWGRRIYRRPDDFIARWYSKLLRQKAWAWTLVRCFGFWVVWMGYCFLCTGLWGVAPFPKHFGLRLLGTVLSVSALAAIVSLPKRDKPAPINIATRSRAKSK